MKKEKTEYFLYCRKSSEDKGKQQLSIPAQIREMKEYAAKNNLTIKKIFQEEKSAKIPYKRKEFNKMVEEIAAGKCNRILCWHLNRISRNPLEGGMIQQMLTDKQIVEIRTPIETVDSTTNDIILGVMFGSNSQYSKELSYNTKRGIREKIMRGEWPTSASVFYINVGEVKGSKTIAPDPRYAKYFEPWIDKIIDQRMNCAQAWQVLKDMGVKTKKGKYYTKSMVHRILRNPVYCGILKYADYPEKEGAWEPLISKSKWYRLQSILADKSKPSQSKHALPYRKLMKCGKCGLSITAYKKTKKSGREYYYLVCTKKNGNCGNDPITVDQMETMIVEQLRQIKLNQEQVDQLKKMVPQKLDQEFEFEINRRKETSAELDKISEKLDRLLSMRLEGELSKKEYEEHREPLNRRQVELSEIQNSIGFNRDEVRRVFEQFFDYAFSLEKIFWQGTWEERTRLFKAIGENIILEDKQIRLNFKEPWLTLLSAKYEENFEKWGG